MVSKRESYFRSADETFGRSANASVPRYLWHPVGRNRRANGEHEEERENGLGFAQRALEGEESILLHTAGGEQRHRNGRFERERCRLLSRGRSA